MTALAAVRVRGVPDTGKKAADTLQKLHLHNKNNCVLLPDSDKWRGMLNRAKDYIAYGEVDADTVSTLLTKRGTVNGVTLPDEIETLGYDSVDDLAAALDSNDVNIMQLRSNGLQVPFRLSPPSKGFNDTKRHYAQGGSLGQRDDMDVLLGRMI